MSINTEKHIRNIIYNGTTIQTATVPLVYAVAKEDGTQGLVVVDDADAVSGGSCVLDTSDADAAASDIASGKIAYVNGEKITGTHVCSSGGGGTQ